MSDGTYTVAGRNLPEISIAVGLIFALWGIGAYVISDMASITAMIPMFIGGPIGLLGLISLQIPDKRKVFMHISAMFGVICTLGGLRLFQILIDGDGSNLLIGSHAILLVLGGVYTYFCVQSFRWARKQREAEDS
ncbi:MAG: hypothetical protein CMB65_03800 [Euryarchaeota archaeon]|nr:hypothetical protein [Euryarchaeota archaeon]|tara:strand:- start:857 stop:1261 length:405 start_codon:yes stop_codon:yes gene_type:complete